MSYYEDERQRMRPTRERSRYDGYDDDSAYNPRGYNRTTTLVRRRDSYDDVDEEVTRDFSPPSGRGGYVKETTVRRSGVRPAARARSFDDDRFLDDRYDDGAFAGARRGDRRRDDRSDRGYRRRESSDYSSRSRTPPKRERRKSRVEEALESAGLGGLVGGILGKDSKDKDRDRRRSRSRGGRDRAYSEARSDRKRSRSRGTTEKVGQAIAAAVLAGAGEAFLTRKEGGGLSGDKGKRILSAAISAGGIDGLLKAGKNPENHKLRDAIGSAVAGLATARVVNGPRSQSRGRGGSPDSRPGRSQSRGGVGDLLAGGAVAAAAKKVYDNVRSKSRGRSESRSRYSDVSRSPSRRRSLSRTAARGLAAVGLTGAASKLDPDTNRDRSRSRDAPRSRRRYSDDYDDRSRSSYYDGGYRDDVGQPQSGEVNGRARELSQSRSGQQGDQAQNQSRNGYSLDFGPRHNGDPDTDSDSDLGCSSDEEKEQKKGKRKWLLTTGLASVATIHAGHSVYQSYEKHQERKMAVAEGKISQEQAKEKQNRDRLQEAASVGIAALGLKGAYSEWKEMKEHREEYTKEIEKAKRHHQKREARRRKYKEIEKHGYLDSGYASSMPNLNSPPPMHPPPGGWNQPFDEGNTYYGGNGPYGMGGYQAGAPTYYDDNPYAGSFARSNDQVGGSPLPPPPVGHDRYEPQAGRAPRQRSMSRGR